MKKNKKLKLNTKTISILEGKNLNDIVGGNKTVTNICNSRNRTCGKTCDWRSCQGATVCRCE